MNRSVVASAPLSEFPLWGKIRDKRFPIAFDLEVTARCNNNCLHCYINVPAEDKTAKEKELSLDEINDIADEAVSLGSLWCLITGGEPLLREDFFDIYLSLRRKGILVSVFTNATLITREHVRLFSKYPPRDIEISVYGVTRKTYERVSRRSGSFDRFSRGLELLLEAGIKVRLKAVALRSNVHELPEIAIFCRERTRDYFRFDPFLHLRFDGNPVRNKEIKSQRLSPEKIVALERSDPERFKALKEDEATLIIPEFSCSNDNRLFLCNAGKRRFIVGYDGLFRICPSLLHPDCVYDLRKGRLRDAWHYLVPKVLDMRSGRRELGEKCRCCPFVNLCMWCPANTYLETGEMDTTVDYFCKVAHARAEMLQKT
jgi:radical SAM protein with 4Fe4S-binding SPASM domain